MFDLAGTTISWGTINWTINLGSDVTDDFLGIANNVEPPTVST